MTIGAKRLTPPTFTAATSYTLGDVIQLPSGRAAYIIRSVDDGSVVQSADQHVSGCRTLTKATGFDILDGGRVYWDVSASNASFRKVNDRDFYVGRAVGDWSSTDVEVEVDFNIDPPYDIDLSRDAYDYVPVLTAGTPYLRQQGGAIVLAFSATAEVQKVDALSKDGFAKTANAIVEFQVEIVDNGDASALDLNIGLANATHASDADAITESVFFHIDGNTLDIFAESDDGTNEVAATDTTINFAEGTRFELWIDTRNPSAVKLYIDGVRVLSSTTFNVNAMTGPFKLLVHMEKTSDDTPGEVHIDRATARYMS